MKTLIIFSLLLAVLLAVPVGCIAPASPATGLPAPATPAILPSTPVVRLKTAITEGPSGTINTGTVTFQWGTLLSSVDPSTLSYATFLQGYEQDYTAFLPDTSRTFTNLPNGNYTFYVKAQNASGQIEPEPANRSFSIANAPPQKVATITIPTGPSGGTLIGADINRLAACSNGPTLYALSSLSGRLFRSDNAGMGWTDISNKIAGGLPWVDVAVAPDDPLFVAVATDSGRDIYISADGGATAFNSTGLSSAIGAGTAASSIAISPAYGSPQREIAAGTWNGSAGGGVFINVIKNFGGGWFNASPDGVDVSAIKYTPDGGTLLLVASSATQTFLYSGARDLGSRNIIWNAVNGYPVELGIPGKGTPGTPLNYSCITLPANYNESGRYAGQIYVSWSRNHTSQGIYRVVDAIAYNMNAPEAIASIAYYGATAGGKLLAGAVKCISSAGCYQVQTYLCTDPASNYPVWMPSQKPPTGSRAAMVAWSADGNMAYAGTSGTESAVSHSRDNGGTWNQ